MGLLCSVNQQENRTRAASPLALESRLVVRALNADLLSCRVAGQRGSEPPGEAQNGRWSSPRNCGFDPSPWFLQSPSKPQATGDKVIQGDPFSREKYTTSTKKL